MRNLLIEIEKCLEELGPNPETRWHTNLQSIRSLFPDPDKISFAAIATSSSSQEEFMAADVWYLTDEEIQDRAARGLDFPKPMVIPAAAKSLNKTPMLSFMHALKKHCGKGLLDVHDFKGPGKLAARKSLSFVGDRLLNPQPRLDNENPPINLLNLKGNLFGQIPAGPQFLNDTRFDVIPALDARLQAKADGKSNPGKRSHAAVLLGREIDLSSCTSFGLCAQRGAWTGFHVDIGDGTWVHNHYGLKAWVFPRGPRSAYLHDLETLGDDWIPTSGIATIILEAGDTLVMPPGPIIPHSAFTVEDCLMSGGMFFDERCIFETLDNIIWIVNHPLVTNEAIPKQLIAGWTQLRELILTSSALASQDGLEAKLDSYGERLEEVLSCDCAGKRGSCKKATCRCMSSMAQDSKCTIWCHRKSKKKKAS
jgi:hypothetical protein